MAEGQDISTMKRPLSPRPLSPRLSIYRWQPAMLASIAHRASGLMLVLFIPIYLWLLHGMTGTPEAFSNILSWMHAPFGRVVLWLVGASLIYHIVNGIRFLCLDAGWGEQRETMRFTARVAIGAGVAGMIALGVMLW